MTEPVLHLAELNVGRLLAPTPDEAPERLAQMEARGFGRRYLNKAQAWKSHGCAQAAAE